MSLLRPHYLAQVANEHFVYDAQQEVVLAHFERLAKALCEPRSLWHWGRSPSIQGIYLYGIRLLELLKQTDIESHLIVSKAGHQTRAYETELSANTLISLADFNYSNADIAASIASGSFKTMGMIIAPCSMRTLADIACGTTSTLMSRAADVVLKERRRLVIMARESPLNLVHIDNMRKVTEMGGIIAPASPAFYAKPNSIDELINHSIGRILDLFDIELGIVQRWEHPAKN